MKKRLILLAILAVTILVGSVYAYMFLRTDPQETAFMPANVTCKVTNGESVVVQNTGNIPAYLRVRLVTYWVDGDGNVVPKTPPVLAITPINGWVTGTDHTYYYPTPRDPEGLTERLLASPISLIEQDGYRQCLDIFAETIQAEPTTAVKEAWNVTLSGTTITAAP